MPQINSGDTAWILASTALVMMMTAPGLAMFYGGLSAARCPFHHDALLLHPLSDQRAVGALGYSLAFGPDVGHFVGNLKWAFLNGVGARAERGLCGHHSPPALHGLPDDVRGHHPRPHQRRIRGKAEVLHLRGVQPSLGDAGL